MHLSYKLLIWFGSACVAWSTGYLWTLNYSMELSWIRSIYQQKKVAAQTIRDTPRIFIVGGSGVHMGLDTQKMSEELSIPVINFGLHAGLGIEAIASSVEPFIQAGDIVVVIPEYGIAGDEDGVGRLAGHFGLAAGLISRMDISWKDKFQSVLGIGNPSLKSLYGTFVHLQKGQPDEGYYTDYLDSFGNPTELKITDVDPGQLEERPAEASLKHLEDFRNFVQAQDAHFVIGLPWYLASTPVPEEAARSFVQEYEKLAPVLYGEDYNIKTDKQLFGDTVYHLSYEGREERSQDLVEQLQPIVERNSNSQL